MSTEPIILNTAEEREFWRDVYLRIIALGLPNSAVESMSDRAVFDLRARTPAAATLPSFPIPKEREADAIALLSPEDQAKAIAYIPIKPTPTYPPGEEPRVVQCKDEYWLVVRGKEGLEWWSPSDQTWNPQENLDSGISPTREDAVSDLNSLSPAQLAAPVGVEVK